MTLDIDRAAARDALARRQQELVRALLDGAPVPSGLDPDRVRLQSAALASRSATRRGQDRPSSRGILRTWETLTRGSAGP